MGEAEKGGEDRVEECESPADLRVEPDAAMGLPTSSSGPLAEAQSLRCLQSGVYGRGGLQKADSKGDGSGGHY